jgi:hypothetical protein
MIIDVQEFLYRWRAVHIHAEHRTLDSLGHVLDELVADAKAKSITLEELNKAAGGNLVEYVRQALSQREP